MDIRKFFTGKKRPNEQPVTASSSNTKYEPEADVSHTPPKQSNVGEVSPDSDLAHQGEDIKQTILPRYPKQGNNRSFQVSWFQKFLWLEYSQKQDAAFCYACRQFQPNGAKGHLVFTYSGFKNWKNATDPRNGFPAHENSKTHLKAMQMWMERKSRVSSGTSVSTLVNNDILEIHRYYIRSIAETIQFLAVNELAFRGIYVTEEHYERGLFINLFKYTLKKDQRLAQSLKHIPENAKYTSPEIQNEIINILAEMVLEKVVDDLKNADVPWFTLLEDGTRDKNNRENISIGVRYVKDGKVLESLLGIYTTDKLDAKTFTIMTLDILTKNGIDRSSILSQCYDGASVMSGYKGGVAALIQKYVGRVIPYVHCFNHRLHLIVIRTVSEIDIIKHFFDQAVMLHEFFSHGKVDALYNGKTIGRLLEQRWSGHIAIVKVIFANYAQIITTLDEIRKGGSFNGQDIAKSSGIKSVMLELEFRFALVFMKKLLGLLEPADSALQTRTISLKEGSAVIKSVKNEIEKLRSTQEFQSLENEANQLLSSVEVVETEKRQTKLSISMKSYLVMEKMPSESRTKDNSIGHKTVYFETLDLVLSLLNERFSENDELINAASNIESFDLDGIKYLEKLGICLPSAEEMAVVKDYFHNKPDADIFSELFKQREVFKKTYALFASVYTLGCSTAVNESSFSTLTAINRPQRYSMSHPRMADLVYLAFEWKRTESLDLNLFLLKFNNRKKRKLQLF